MSSGRRWGNSYVLGTAWVNRTCVYVSDLGLQVWLWELKKRLAISRSGFTRGRAVCCTVYRPGKRRLARAQAGVLALPRTRPSTRLQRATAVTCHHWPPCPMNRAGTHHFPRNLSPHRPRPRPRLQPRPPRLPHNPQRGRRAQHASGVEARRLAATTGSRVPAAARLVRTASGPVPSTPKGWSCYI